MIYFVVRVRPREVFGRPGGLHFDVVRNYKLREERWEFMRKVLKIGICSLLALALLTGCSNNKKEETQTDAAVTAAADSEVSSGQDSVTLGEYMGVLYTPVSAEVTDEQIEAEIQALIDANPVITEVDRAAKEGDVVNIDYVGMKDGVAFQGGTSQGYNLTLGSGSFIDGFEDGLIGTKKGQEVSLNLTFPEEYGNAELAGQDVVFDVTVNAVQESTPAVLDDKFVAANTDYTTVQECRAGIRKDLEDMAADNAQTQKKNQVFMKVMDVSDVTVSDETVQKYYDEQMEAYENQAASFGMELKDMVQDMDSFQSQLMELSREIARQNLVVDAIAQKENIAVEDSDREAMAGEFGFTSAEEMIQAVGQEAVDGYLLPNKVMEFLADNAVEE